MPLRGIWQSFSIVKFSATSLVILYVWWKTLFSHSVFFFWGGMDGLDLWNVHLLNFPKFWNYSTPFPLNANFREFSKDSKNWPTRLLNVFTAGYQFVKQKGPYEPGGEEAWHHAGPEFCWASYQLWRNTKITPAWALKLQLLVDNSKSNSVGSWVYHDA